MIMLKIAPSNKIFYIVFASICSIINTTAMTRQSKQLKLFRESHHLRMCCEWVKRILPNMVSELRTEPLG